MHYNIYLLPCTNKGLVSSEFKLIFIVLSEEDSTQVSAF